MGKGETIRLPFGAIRPIFKGFSSHVSFRKGVFLGMLVNQVSFSIEAKGTFVSFQPPTKTKPRLTTWAASGARHIRRDRPFTQAESPSNQGSFPAPVLKHVIRKKMSIQQYTLQQYIYVVDGKKSCTPYIIWKILKLNYLSCKSSSESRVDG